MAVDAVEVIMPQMGESIAEATITAWHKQVGDAVDEGEKLLDISTAKVEVEIPSPAAGVISQLFYQPGDTVAVDTIIALLLPGGSAATIPVRAKAEPKVVHRDDTGDTLEPESPEPIRVRDLPMAVQPVAPRPSNGTQRREEDVESDRHRLMQRRSSPLVRKMAREHGIDLDQVEGTGSNGRVTRRDFEQFLRDREKQSPEQMQEVLRELSEEDDLSRPVGVEAIDESPISLPMSAMRRSIAENLLRSIRTTPHAYTVHEIDFNRVEALRRRMKTAFESQYQTKLTPLVFLVRACAEGLLRVPALNAAWKVDHIERHRTANIGIAVAVKDGLLVPVLKRVERMSLMEISRGIAELAAKARAGKLRPEDMQGGTFSITSPGQLGALFAIPIINQQQGAILHFGAIHKVPAVITGPDGEDCIAIRQHAFLTLGLDHRLVDGWEADTFMSAVRERIENADIDVFPELRRLVR